MTTLLGRACAVLALVAVGCGEEPDLDAIAQRARTAKPIVTLRVPADETPGWTLPEGAVRPWQKDDRSGAVITPGEEPVTITFPAPDEAAGAGHVSVRVMSDGPFEVQMTLGDHTTRVATSGSTRRRWKELTFALPAPLAADAVAKPMSMTRVTSELPVLVEAIRFLP
ncbi:MAG: hypothetical protein AAF957_19720 [Planctomycetota bacterium]